MKSFLKVAFGPVVLGSLGVLALCALVWWVGPLVADRRCAVRSAAWRHASSLIALLAARLDRPAGLCASGAGGAPMPSW